MYFVNLFAPQANVVYVQVKQGLRLPKVAKFFKIRRKIYGKFEKKLQKKKGNHETFQHL